MSRPSTTLHTGDAAPSFCLNDAFDEEACLADLLQQGPVLLYFFRGTWCPNCRKQWRELAPWIDRYAATGAILRGVMAQAAPSVRAFAQKPGLPFPMLLDPARAVIKAYGVWHMLGIDAVNIARPSTFLIGQDGTVKWMFVSSNQLDRPAPAALLEHLEQYAAASSGAAR